jgi:hypothetical protein
MWSHLLNLFYPHARSARRAVVEEFGMMVTALAADLA